MKYNASYDCSLADAEIKFCCVFSVSFTVNVNVESDSESAAVYAC